MSVVVPVIDIAPALRGGIEDRRRVARKIGDACENVGFFQIVGHGVSIDLIEDMYDVSLVFFDLPEAQKLPFVPPTPRDPGYRGMAKTALGQTLGKATPPDLKENLLLRSDRQNWPTNPPAFATITTRYFAALEQLTKQMMHIFALALDLPETYFDDKVAKPDDHLSLVNYPILDVPPLPGQLRVGVHTDYGSTTFLYKAPGASGLQVSSHDGTWVDVDPVHGGFIINIGDLMAQWTNDRWLSTLHRVVVPEAVGDPDSRRLSVVFFHAPHPDTIVEPLPTCVTDARPAKYAPVTARDHLRSKLDLTYAKAAAK